MRYFIGFLVTMFLIIILVVLLFSGGHKSNNLLTPSGQPKSTAELAAYADTDAVTQLVIDGPIVSDQNHTAVRITVGQQDVTYEQIQGYEGTVVNKQVYQNNTSAYSNFLYALGHGGFYKTNNDPKLANEKGYCPLGQRYVMTLSEGSNTIERSWATNCGGSYPKTYKGNLNLTLRLFRAQVPNYNDLTQNLQYLSGQ